MPNGANNRLTRWGGKTYSYDPNGNLLADGTHSYQWNERNQLTGLSAGATSLASFSYDSLGRRSAKTVAGATTGFVYDGDTFVQELLGASSNSAVKAQLLTGGIDETFLRIEGTSRHSVLADGNNNTVRLLDANQAKVVDYTYEPYGRTTADATNGNTQQYTGRENDNPGNAGGLYYYRARYYMPGCARFISEDPIGWASGQTNNYSYVGGDPISWNDPFGLGTCTGQARVYQGNSALIGKGGGFNGSPSNIASYGVTADSAAVVPSQFGLNKREMRPYLDKISGTLSDGTTFGRVRDIMDDAKTRRALNMTTSQFQQHLISREAAANGGVPLLLLELPGINRDPGVLGVTINVPDGVSCPTGTK